VYKMRKAELTILGWVIVLLLSGGAVYLDEAYGIDLMGFSEDEEVKAKPYPEIIITDR